MPVKLTPKLVRKLFPEDNTKQIERLNLAGKDISEVSTVVVSASFFLEFYLI